MSLSICAEIKGCLKGAEPLNTPLQVRWTIWTQCSACRATPYHKAGGTGHSVSPPPSGPAGLFYEAAQAHAQHGLTCGCRAQHRVGKMKRSCCSSVSPVQQRILTESIQPATVQAFLKTQKLCYINQHGSETSIYFTSHWLLRSSSYFSPTLNHSCTPCFIEVKTCLYTRARLALM